MRLRNTLLGFTAALALSAGAASAADFVFPIGEGAQFNWKSLEDFKAAHGDLAGQTLTIFGPWRGEDDTLFRLITLGTGSLSPGGAFQKQGFVRKGSENVVGPMPPYGDIIKTEDDIWKIIAWIRSKNCERDVAQCR